MISPEDFYGEVSIPQRKIEAQIKKSPLKKPKPLPPFLSSLLGPSHTWKVFPKQEQAIRFARERGCGLMPFVFQHSGGQRSFLVCHPIVFWFRYSQRNDKDKSTYEIIVENKTCKLYLDVEFEYEFNAGRTLNDGEKMLETFLKVLQNFLADNLDLNVEDSWFLDLDSSTDRKFSRHVIVNIPGKAFACNLTVGNVVKAVCSQIRACLEDENNCALYGISRQRLGELFVEDRKGLKKLFVDQGVYTKNRHFRILGSTKLLKNAPLVVSSRNKFQPKDKHDDSLFLSSLVTYFDTNVEIIEYGCRRIPDELKPSFPPLEQPCESATCFDSFITSISAPNGKIRKRVRQGSRIKYDVANYRFCGNIGREHKSNNVSFVVDTARLTIWQTCYDPDCEGYTSPEKALPAALCLSDEDASLFEVAEEVFDAGWSSEPENFFV